MQHPAASAERFLAMRTRYTTTRLRVKKLRQGCFAERPRNEKPGVLKECRTFVLKNRGDSPFPMDNGGFLDMAALAIFPEYLAFDGEEVLQLAVPGASGRTVNLLSSP